MYTPELTFIHFKKEGGKSISLDSGCLRFLLNYEPPLVRGTNSGLASVQTAILHLEGLEVARPSELAPGFFLVRRRLAARAAAGAPALWRRGPGTQTNLVRSNHRLQTVLYRWDDEEDNIWTETTCSHHCVAVDSMILKMPIITYY
jgi:hypothetical protein